VRETREADLGWGNG